MTTEQPMFVQGTLVGTVVTEPDRQTTSRGKAAVNLAVSTAEAGADDPEAITWLVTAYGEMAEPVTENLTYGDPVIIHGFFVASSWRDAEGTERTTILVRAQSVALDLIGRRPEVLLTLRGRVVATPRLGTYENQPLAELEVRTSRYKRGDTSDEADITHWPVAAGGAAAERVADWRAGDAVMVVGRARPLADPPPNTPLVEIWVEAAGVELAAEPGPGA